MFPDYKSNQLWPPDEWKAIYDCYNEWSAWYSGDALQISEALSAKISTPTRHGQFWAQEIKNERKVMLHIPIAGELASTSSSFLFSETPTITIPGLKFDDDKVKNMRRLLEQNNFFSIILEAAEIASAMSGIFLKVNWDKNLFPFPVLNIAQPDAALPEFRFGILVAVTFWKVILDDGDTVYRFLERHDRGVIYSKLFKGSVTELGIEVPLSTFTETKDYEAVRNTFIKDDIMVRYIPNMRPNKIFRGSAIGQSDFGGNEGLMDALDETYTCWIRDIRLGKGRVIVPAQYLRDIATGNPRFDFEEEVFEELDYDPNDVAGAGSIKNVQFEIRHESFQNTCYNLIARIVSNAGYAPQSFGLGGNTSVSDSGYALTIKEKKSIITSAKKARYWKSALEDLLTMMLTINNNSDHERPNIEINDYVTSDMSTIASTLNLLNAAQAASIYTKVKMANRDWTEEQIESEVTRILDEARILGTKPLAQGSGNITSNSKVG
ncbi:MAG TPA: hypothetical protein DDW65_21600 [Firmicutes bacterium]|jgi:A118 family predicted phage portal protein|nr:hypothetical protein [Bacillota bacterium]